MKFKSIYLIACAIMVMALASCKKALLEANTTPTAITADTYDPNLLLTTVQIAYTGSSDFGADNWYDEWGEVAEFIQHTSSTSGFYTGDKYLNSGSFGVYFDHNYPGQVQPVVELFQLTRTNPKYRNLHQMARIIKALVFERMTDLYGDIPYFQAGLGYYDRIYTPVYDKQQDIYADLLKEVSQAVDSLDEAGDKPTGDVFYAVNHTTQIAQWKKFGNTLLLRMAMRLTKVDPNTAKAYATKLQGLTMTSNADNAIVQHQAGNDATQNRDAWAIFGQDSTDVQLSERFVTFMQQNKDPRLHIVSWIYRNNRDTISADQFGLPQGKVAGGTIDSISLAKIRLIDKYKKLKYPTTVAGYSRLNNNILNTSAPNLILTYAESEFLLADAAKRWGIGVAKTHYENGLKAALMQLSAYGDVATISDADAASYVRAHPYNDADGLNQINSQFWASTLMNAWEAWSNWRRTGFPVLTPTNYPGNITNATIPRRLPYPPSQKVSNGVNYSAAVARLPGGDKLTSRVWWDTASGN